MSSGKISVTYKSPEHEAVFLSELQRIPHIVNPESGRINPYWGASLYLLSALTRWPELRIAVIGDDYMAFAAAKEAFNLSQNERIVVELAANFYNAGLFVCRVSRWSTPPATRLSRSFLRRSACAVQSSFTKMGRCPQNGKKENEPPARRRHPAPCRCG